MQGEIGGLLHAGLSERSKKTKSKVLMKLLDSMTCSICHDYMFVPMMAQCGQNFCYSCITSWFESNTTKELSCPHCRSSINEEPHLNSTLQQLLNNIIELLTEKKKDDGEFQNLLNEQNQSIATYKSDLKLDNLFNGIFKVSAIGVVDEDDDGILRCSNCHWELEDDEDELCPHCNSRIRSRMASNNRSRGLDNEEEDESGLENQSNPTDEYEFETVQELYRSIQGYRSQTQSHIREYQNNGANSSDQFQADFPHVVVLDVSSNSRIYFPSYSIYTNNDNTFNENEREIRTRLVREIEHIEKEGGDINQLRPSAPGQRFNPSTGYFSESDFSDNVSEDDHCPSEPGNLIDLEADDSRDEDEYDSDFYEHNEEDDGFVTGDSLDDVAGEEEYLDDDENSYGASEAQSDGQLSEPDNPNNEFNSYDDDQDIIDFVDTSSGSKKRKHSETRQDTHSKDHDDDDGDDDDDDDENTFRIPRRKFQIIEEGSDED